MNRTASSISVIIPACNEAGTIQSVVAGIKANLGNQIQLLVVDDGSNDGTARIAEMAGAEILRHSTNRGKGTALRTGIASSTGDLIITIDADGQDDPRDLPALLERAEEGADLVIGSRFIGRLEPGAISLPNRMGTHFFNLLINTLYKSEITDSQAGVRCFRRSLLNRMQWRATEYEVETEMLIQALKLGATVAEVPVSRYKRAAGVTSFSRLRHGIRLLSTVVAGTMP